MKKRSLQFITVLISLCIALTASAGDFKNVVVFGASYSDTGNVFAMNGGYPPVPYYNGRISDGPVWVEYLVESLGIEGLFLNYACSGAQTGETNTTGDYPGFLNEINIYLNSLEVSNSFPSAFALPKDSLFIIDIGGNDFWNVTDPAASISQAIENIQTGLTELVQAGAIQFFVVNGGDFGKIPKFNKDVVVATQASQLIAAFNLSLEQLISGFEAMNPQLTFTRFDLFTLTGYIVENFEEFGFMNVIDAKLDKESEVIAEGNYLFWDDIHPTTVGHKLLSDFALQEINCESCRGNRLPYFEEGLSITVPRIELGDDAYGFKLLPYINPDAEGFFWKLDLSTLTTVE